MQTGTYQPSKSVIRVSPFEGHTSYAPYTCTQCDEGWCMTACPVGAITITPAGAKDVVDDQCVGCKLCTIACPYGTMFYDPATPKPSSAISAMASRPAPTPVRRRRSSMMRRRRRTGSATSRAERASHVLGAGRAADGTKRHLIIGGGTAGHERHHDHPRGRSRAPRRSCWCRPSGHTHAWCCRTISARDIAESHVFTATPSRLAQWKVKTLTSAAARQASTPRRNALTLDNGTAVEYDDCLIATGSSAVRAPVPGADGQGVH